jgi:histidine triad (HIT) family protein
VTLRLAHGIRAGLAPPGLSIRQANGRIADQRILHFHIHLIPRYEGAPRGDRARIADSAKRIRAALA